MGCAVLLGIVHSAGRMVVDPAGENRRQKWSLTQQAFDGLLATLGPDRGTAADRYLTIRRNLVRLFEWRGCPTPDEYADEAINRCAKKIGEGEEIRDVATYCIGIARMLLLEMSRERAKEASLDKAPEPQAHQPDDDQEFRMECLRRCLEQLPPENRKLILHYYQGEKDEKIKNRKGLMEVFGVPASTLRMRALRLREGLHLCSENCVQRQEGTSL
jgi:DNA-directed RNA polymerase specialized sigma24 family protein